LDQEILQAHSHSPEWVETLDDLARNRFALDAYLAACAE
jgi:hypothetical protein